MRPVQLPFLDREAELGRFAAALRGRGNALLCLYGRRRLGKSRLVQRLLAGRRAAYYVGDDRDAPLQREALAREIARLVPGFAAVSYPGWEALLDRWWQEAPDGAMLALDEFPSVVAASPELPSLLQKRLDRPSPRSRRLILCGSSQRMMLGLVLDASAPLYGRAREIVRVGPLGLRWLRRAFRLRDPVEAIEHHAVWGGVPRYWELALDHRSRWAAVQNLLLDPLGVLHAEPERLLLDDLSELARAASILALVGRGCHRSSEVAARLGVPATSLSRPLVRLVELGFLERDVPFGRSTRDTKRTYYRIADPLLGFWYRFVEPNRSRLAQGQLAAVREDVQRAWPAFLGRAWEEIARQGVARLRVAGLAWRPAARWWGAGTDGRPLDIDIVAAASRRPGRVLVGEAKLACRDGEEDRLLAALREKAGRCPALQGKHVTCALWLLRARRRRRPGAGVIVTAEDVVRAC